MVMSNYFIDDHHDDYLCQMIKAKTKLFVSKIKALIVTCIKDKGFNKVICIRR
jgi:hypothetical protein